MAAQLKEITEMSSGLYEEKIKREKMNKNSAKNYYELLAIPLAATAREIEDAYSQAWSTYSKKSKQAVTLHPGEGRDNLLQELQKAYNTLRDPIKRQAYNVELSTLINENRGDGSDGNFLRLHTLKNELAEKEVQQYITLKKSLIVMGERDPITTEQYRILFTKIEHISQTKFYKSFAVTSSLKGEGKTSTSFNLAYIMAHEFKKKVLLLDGDLRKPSIKSYLQDNGPAFGLIDIIKGDVELNEAIVRLKGSSLFIITSGGHTRNSSELLSSERMASIISSLKEKFDYLIIDSPPIISLADMNIISKVVDGTLLVVRAGETPRDIVLKAVESLTGCNIVGLILNGAEAVTKKYKYYY